MFGVIKRIVDLVYCNLGRNVNRVQLQTTQVPPLNPASLSLNSGDQLFDAIEGRRKLLGRNCDAKCRMTGRPPQRPEFEKTVFQISIDDVPNANSPHKNRDTVNLESAGLHRKCPQELTLGTVPAILLAKRKVHLHLFHWLANRGLFRVFCHGIEVLAAPLERLPSVSGSFAEVALLTGWDDIGFIVSTPIRQ